MLFESRSFWHAKSLEFAQEYEDAYAVGDNGVVTIADGVSSAIFSRTWARILTSAVVEQPPNLGDTEGFRDWLAQRRSQWLQSIDLTKLNFFQRQKLQQVGGAYSTLLWTEFSPWQDAGELPEENGGARYLMRCFAIGDCCLFHIRDGQLLRRFPLETLDEFAQDPITICSVNRNHDHLLEFHTLEDICRAGDLLFVTSDALAKWIYQELDAESPVDWNGFWNMTEDDWNRRVAALRDLPAERRMRVDDTTLVMLRLGPPVPLWEPSSETIAISAVDVAEKAALAPAVEGDDGERVTKAIAVAVAPGDEDAAGVVASETYDRLTEGGEPAEGPPSTVG